VQLQNYMEEKRKWFNEEMYFLFNQLNIPKRLKDSMYYSLQAGGKRIRPILMFAAIEHFNKDLKKAVVPAVALEMIHTYSLIHDDLPAMDNDDLRRGKPTNHKMFDEATAILAGDGLLTAAFYLISISSQLQPEEKIFVMKELAKASGPEGMVAGQMLDLEGEEKSLSIKELKDIHGLKTGELIRFAIRCGAYLGGATPPQIEALDEYAKAIGLIFQIQDDILDVIGEEKEIGKRVGSDEERHKSTYPKILGLNGAIEEKKYYINKAKTALQLAEIYDGYLYEMIDFVGNRNH
jgi:geranylgeranyl diphosphate synthase, type II